MERKLDLLENIRVLILDTDDSTRCSLTLSLGKRGCSVVDTGSSLDALHMLCEEEFDVILVSLGTSSRESIYLLQSIKRVGSSAETILLRKTADFDLAIESMKLGVFDDLVYPIDLELLAARVKDGSNKKRYSLCPAGIHIWYGIAQVA